MIELIKLAVDHAEVESRERQEAAAKKAEEEALALLEGMGMWDGWVGWGSVLGVGSLG